MIKKVLIGVAIAGLIQKISYAFFLGLLLGSLGTAITLYVLALQLLRKHHKGADVTFELIQHDIKTALNPLKRPRGHYINRFTNYIIARERAESDHAEAGEPGDARKQVDVKLLKLNRKTYLKLVEQYTAFVDKIREAEAVHAEQLGELDSRGKVQAESDYTVQHRYGEGHWDIVQQLTGIDMREGYWLLLPQWREVRKVARQFGICHGDQARMMQHSVNELLHPLRKEYTREVEEQRKQRRKLKASYFESFQYFSKIQTEFNGIDKEAQTLQHVYNEMTKRKEDPEKIIKQEMKVKLQMSALDNVRTKLTDARERLKEVSRDLIEFNGKLGKFTQQWEEQRLVSMKQCYQSALVGFEDLAHKIQAQILNLIVILDADKCQIYPNKSQQCISSPTNAFVQMIQNGQIEELELADQLRECIKSTEYLLQQWTAVQKYNEEVELMLKELTNAFSNQASQLDQDYNQIKKVIDLDKSKPAETFVVIVQCMIKTSKIMKEGSKSLSEGLEKRRQDVAKHRLDMGVGVQVGAVAQKHYQQLLQLYQDQRIIEKYQDESDSKTSKVANHFISEMKSSMKGLSVSKFLSSVGKTVDKVSKMSSQSEKDMVAYQQKIREEQKSLISLLGYSLKNIEDLLIRQSKTISKVKKQVIDELGRYCDSLNTNIGLIIDEMTQSISNIQQRQEQEVVAQNEEKAAEQVEEAPQEQSVEDFEIYTPAQIISKLLRVWMNEWKQNDYFREKLTKLLQKTFNKKRATVVTEIVVSDLKFVGDPPAIQNVYAQRQDIDEFLFDFDISFRGKVQFMLNTNILINWPKENYAKLPVEIKVAISTFTSRMRVCFVPSYLGKSWISLIGIPVLKLDLEPRVLQKYNIASIPSVGDIMKELLIHKVKLMTFPNKLSIPIPLSKKSKKKQT